jgi:hypothetical protein
MRIALIILLSLFLCNTLLAQSSESNLEKGKFKKENLFIGTGFNVGIASRGYSVTKWLDGGIALNLNYFSQNPSDYSSIKYQNLSYGAGSFIRVWPVSFFHIQIQPEFNWINSTQKNTNTNVTQKYNYHAGSLLVGIGYGSHFIGNRYSYVTLMIDVLQDKNSPYRDQFNDPIPVFKAGFGMYLKPSRK